MTDLTVDEAISFLATKHGMTEDLILAAIAQGHEGLRRQFARLAAHGIIAMHEANKLLEAV